MFFVSFRTENWSGKRIYNQEMQKPGFGNECVFIIRVHLMGLQNTLLPFLYLFETDPSLFNDVVEEFQ